MPGDTLPMEISDGASGSSARDTKYDRQLRLWGANGQKALMGAKILLLNAGKCHGSCPLGVLS